MSKNFDSFFKKSTKVFKYILNKKKMLLTNEKL